jgi:chromosome segregation ATPase
MAVPTKRDVKWWADEVGAFMEGCRDRYETNMSHIQAEAASWRDQALALEGDLREAGRDLRKAQEDRAQLDSALAASRLEIEGLKRGFASQQAQLQAAHEELSSLREANSQLTDRLARTGPPLAADERPTLEALTSQSSTRAQEINELKAAQVTDRAQIEELRRQLRTRPSGLSPDQMLDQGPGD